ncbi:hypothetical protein [Streptomyces calvus]
MSASQRSRDQNGSDRRNIDAFDATVAMVAEAPGSARLLLAPNVVHLAPEAAVFTAMKEGWARQQQARFLKASTIEPRLRLINRFEVFTGLYPWQWTPADGEAFITHLRSGANPIRMSRRGRTR